MTLAEPLAVTLDVAAALEKLGLRYAVGGSFASSVHGIPRSTQDVDLLVELPLTAVAALVAELTGRFYVDADMIREAIRRGASFNVIHLATMFKVDMFVSSRSPLLREEMERRQAVELGEPPGRLFVCSPEDVVLHKLDWFEKGSRVSDRQWSDLVGVLRIRGTALDVAYMRRWGRALGVSELLEEALAEAGLAGD